jgi:hypothetical protein
MANLEFRAIETADLPWYYRVLLKIPGGDFLANVSSGIFWAIVVPIFLLLYAFINLTLLVAFSFPLNILLAAIIPTTLLLIFVRMSLFRFLLWWNESVVKTSLEWNVEKRLEEYLAMMKKKEEQNLPT